MFLHLEEIMNIQNYKIKIGQLNSMRSANVLHEVRRTADELHLDIVCLQEPYSVRGTVPGMPTLAKTVTQGERPMTATVVYNMGIMVHKISQFCDSNTIVVEIITEMGNFILVNMYCQFIEPIGPYLEKIRSINNTYSQIPILYTMDK